MTNAPNNIMVCKIERREGRIKFLGNIYLRAEVKDREGKEYFMDVEIPEETPIGEAFDAFYKQAELSFKRIQSD